MASNTLNSIFEVENGSIFFCKTYFDNLCLLLNFFIFFYLVFFIAPVFAFSIKCTENKSIAIYVIQYIYISFYIVLCFLSVSMCVCRVCLGFTCGRYKGWMSSYRPSFTCNYSAQRAR